MSPPKNQHPNRHSEWLAINLPRYMWPVTSETSLSSQSLTCTATDNQTRTTKRHNTTHKHTNWSQWKMCKTHINNNWESVPAVVDGCGRLDVRHLILLRRIQFFRRFIWMTVCCIIVLLYQVTVCTITAWYQFLHAAQPGMSICIFELVLLTDVVDELIQCLYFTFYFTFYLSRLIVLTSAFGE